MALNKTDSANVSGAFVRTQFAWSTRQMWHTAFPKCLHWVWIHTDLPKTLHLESICVDSCLPQKLIIVEHPWQIRWLQAQWQLNSHLAGTLQSHALPKVTTLNAWLSQTLALHNSQAVTQQTAAITVWHALDHLRRTLKRTQAADTVATSALNHPTGRWALAQQLVALLVEVESVQHIQPNVLDRLLNSPSIWLSREAQWLKAVQQSVSFNAQTYWQAQIAALSHLAKQQVYCVMPSVHPSGLMQSFIHQLPPQVMIAIPDPECDITACEPELKVFSDFEAEAVGAAQWVKQQLNTAAMVGVVAHNRALARRIAAILARDNIQINDKVGWALSTTIAASCVKGFLDIVTEQETMPLFHWLSLPMVQAAWPSANAVQQFLHTLWLRYEVEPTHALFMRHAVKTAQETQDMQDVNQYSSSQDLLGALRIMSTWQAQWSQQQTVAGFATLLTQNLQFIANDISKDPAGALVWRCIEDLQLEPSLEPIPAAVFTRLLQTRLESERFAPAMPLAKVQFLPMYEAAWTDLNALLMVGCNELHFPPRPTVVAPLLSSVQKELGLPAPEAEYAVWRHVMSRIPHGLKLSLSYATQENGNPTRVSPWVTPFVQQAQDDTSLIQTAVLNNTRVKSSDQAQVVHSSLLKMPHNENAKVRLQAQPTPANISGVRLPKELSATQLAQLGQCPYKFILSSALGIKAQSHPSLWPSHREKGTVLHQALSQTVMPLYRPETLKTTLLAALELLNSTLSPISGRYTALIEDAKAMIPSFVKAQELRQEQGWQVFAVEHEQRYAEFFQELTLKAKPDRVDIHRQNQLTHYAVIDYKTSSQQTLQTKVKNTLSDAQLLLYTAALISEGKQLTQALYWRLSDTSKPLIEMEVDADQIEPILNALEQAWNMLLSGEAAHAIPSELNCEYCDFAGVCRVKGESMDKDTQ